MKQILSTVIILLSVNAFATKARVQALSNSFHLVDPQTVFGNPLDLMSMKDYISLESGATGSASTTDNAEGSISYGLNDHSQIAISIGHKDDAIMGARSLINTTLGLAYETPQNPVHVFYGFKGADLTYAFGISYSNKEDKKNSLKDNSSLGSFGVQAGNFQAYTVYSFSNNADLAGNKKFEGAGYLNLAARYSLDTVTLGLDFYSAKAKSSTNDVEVASDAYQSFVLGFVDTKDKDGSQYFYGVQFISSALKNRMTGNDFKRSILPIWFGVEAKGSDWLTIRGSIQQTLFIAQSKDDQGFAAGDGYLTGATGAVSDFAAAPNNTTAAFGLGFNFKNVTIDGTLKGLIGSTANQQIDQNNFLSQVGLTYNY